MERYVIGGQRRPAHQSAPTAQLGRPGRRWTFDPDAPFTGPDGATLQGYVWHCHMLDHEDHEMMRRLRVKNPAAPAAPVMPEGGHDHGSHDNGGHHH